MTSTITAAQLQALGIAAQWLEPLNAAMARFNINTPKRMAAFIGQCAHESANFATLTENLNYRMESLVNVWPRHFPTLDVAAQYHRKPEQIANRAYANRMGNGPEASGEGWKYRGRGLIQLTGKDNYQLASDALRVDLVENPDTVTEPAMAAMTAAWFWNKRGLNELADKGENENISKRINGGTHGMDDRLQRTSTALALLTRPGNTGNTETATA
jgi:putative chitinase